MSAFKSDFLRVMSERGFIHQISDEAGLDELFHTETVTAYIGFDATAKSLHAGSLIQIMMLHWMQKTGRVRCFTAATGQTIGKMAAGIRVVGTSPADVIHDRVTFGRAVLRTAGYFASLLPAGLGFLPAFVGPRDHRALHDRLAETRVVRA